MYDTIKEYYDMGIYSKEDVRSFIVAGWITPEEYSQITGEAY